MLMSLAAEPRGQLAASYWQLVRTPLLFAELPLLTRALGRQAALAVSVCGCVIYFLR